MADRSRRARRPISDITEEFSEDQSASESGEDWDPRKTDAARRAGKNEAPISRAKRGNPPSAATDSRGQSIKLTMKVAPSKLREVMRANEVDSLQDTLGGGRVIDGPRSRRSVTNSRISDRPVARPKYAEYGESDLEDEEEEEEDDDEHEEEDDGEEEGEEEEEATGAEVEDDEEEEDEEDEEDVEGDEDANGFNELGAEAEGGTDDEDVEMEDAPIPAQPVRRHQNQPKPPKITLKPPPKAEAKQGAKAKVIVSTTNVGPVKSVEDQEMDDESEEEEDEESSELSDDGEDVTNLNEPDAEGETELIEDEEIGADDDEEMDDDEDLDDSGNETPGSGAATPDPNRLTKRQRGRPEDQGQLMALDMAPQQRKFFTDEEKAMKKDEHARKRKELTKRKIIEEKTAALNRLLKPQASKARGAAPKPETLAAAAAAAATEEDIYVEKADPLYTRWISTKDGIRLGVPEEWLGKRVGRSFGAPLPPSNGALVQEVD